MTPEEVMKAYEKANTRTKRQIVSDLTGTRRDTRLVSISGAARLMNLSRNTVYTLIETNRLDTVEINGSSRVTMQSVTEFIDGLRPANAATKKVIERNKARYNAAAHGKVA